jgi:hypothetical protein
MVSSAAVAASSAAMSRSILSISESVLSRFASSVVAASAGAASVAVALSTAGAFDAEAGGGVSSIACHSNNPSFFRPSRLLRCRGLLLLL